MPDKLWFLFLVLFLLLTMRFDVHRFLLQGPYLLMPLIMIFVSLFLISSVLFASDLKNRCSIKNVVEDSSHLGCDTCWVGGARCFKGS
jgi:CDP-diglyceride synthetase